MSEKITLNDLPLTAKGLEGVKGGWDLEKNVGGFTDSGLADSRRQSLQMISNISKS